MLRPGVDVKRREIDRLYRPLRTQRFDELSGSLGSLDHEMPERARDLDRALGQDLRRRHDAEQVGDQIQATWKRTRCDQRICMPTAISMSVRRIRGRPINAVGSSLAMREKSAIPSDSHLTE